MKKNILSLKLLICLSILTATAQQTLSPKLLFDEGFKYAHGINKPHDPGKALDLFTQSANAGYVPAMNALGNVYLKGLGTRVNVNLAIYWYKKASQNGYASASFNLGSLYQKGELVTQNFPEAAKYYQAGASAGELDCKNKLAYFYFKGLGIQQSYDKAFNLYQEIALKGNTNAQYFLGLCYRNGYGTSVNITLSKQWLQSAAIKKDRQAIHELTKEPLPENMSTITPELQNKVAILKNYQEKFIAANSNNIAGSYQGFAVYYDFSKTYVNAIVPLKLIIMKTIFGYEGTWTEGDSLRAEIKAAFHNNNLFFDSSSQYTRRNYYSYEENERYLFNNAALSIKYIEGNMYLSGEVRFYSLSRREPGHPMYISLSKKFEEDDNVNDNQLKLTISPNPTTAILKATFTLGCVQNVQLQLLSIDGRPLQQIGERKLPAGTYSYDFDVRNLAGGSYILRVLTNGLNSKEISKTFIKF